MAEGETACQTRLLVRPLTGGSKLGLLSISLPPLTSKRLGDALKNFYLSVTCKKFTKSAQS